jgi:hypothetical protein
MRNQPFFAAGLFCAAFLLTTNLTVQCQPAVKTYAEYLRNAAASGAEIEVFLHKPSWAQFDPEVGYILGNYAPRDGIDESRTISTVRPDGARTSFVYTGRPCRINTYGNSFTQCHQASDAETWQEYLAGHLGEPIRNYGMGGFGVYQAYRRMLREEKTENAAEYILLYIWGDDHIRSLLRCRYALISGWNKAQDKKEGTGVMFHGNFWANIEMNMETGRLREHESRIREPENLVKMTDPDWMHENLIDDLALQMYLYKLGRISDIDTGQMEKLAIHLQTRFDPKADDLRAEVGELLDQYAYAATRYILDKSRAFARDHGKKLMVLLFDPYGAMRQLLQGQPRKDQQIVDFLEENDYNYFDMNLIHLEDYRDFNLSIEDYYDRYFIGHYNPQGNHFFAYSLKSGLVKWLDPKPFTYQPGDQPSVDFAGYLEGLENAR